MWARKQQVIPLNKEYLTSKTINNSVFIERMQIIITLQMWKLKTSTKHHHSFVSITEPDIPLLITPANTTRSSHAFRICQKSTGKTQTEAWRLNLLLVTRKEWFKNVEMRQKTVQSHCNNVRSQRFHNKRALARTRYEAFGATECFRKDEREGRELDRAANKNCLKNNSNYYVWVCSGTAKLQELGPKHSKATWVGK